MWQRRTFSLLGTAPWSSAFPSTVIPSFQLGGWLTSLCFRLLGKRKLDQACQVSGKVKLRFGVWVMLRMGMLETVKFTTQGRQQIKQKSGDVIKTKKKNTLATNITPTGFIHHTAYSLAVIRIRLCHPNTKLKLKVGSCVCSHFANT